MLEACSLYLETRGVDRAFYEGLPRVAQMEVLSYANSLGVVIAATRDGGSAQTPTRPSCLPPWPPAGCEALEGATFESIADLCSLVEETGSPSAAYLRSLSDEELAAVIDYASAVHLAASDHDDLEVPERPKCLEPARAAGSVVEPPPTLPVVGTPCRACKVIDGKHLAGCPRTPLSAAEDPPQG